MRKQESPPHRRYSSLARSPAWPDATFLALTLWFVCSAGHAHDANSIYVMPLCEDNVSWMTLRYWCTVVCGLDCGADEQALFLGVDCIIGWDGFSHLNLYDAAVAFTARMLRILPADRRIHLFWASDRNWHSAVVVDSAHKTRIVYDDGTSDTIYLPFSFVDLSSTKPAQHFRPAPNPFQPRPVIPPSMPFVMRGPGRVIMQDLSNGFENLPVPVINDVNDNPPPDISYTADYYYGTLEACNTLAKMFQKKMQRASIQCNAPRSPYSSSGKLFVFTLEDDRTECNMMTCTAASCCASMVVTRGVTLPFQVFHTRTRGYGLRCAIPISMGHFLCVYAGELITSQKAEQRPHTEMYHWGIGDEPHFIVIDASTYGNIGRFVNHSCNPNCISLIVYAKNCRFPFLHYIALFARRDIDAFEEITVDYEGSGFKVQCSCGSSMCRGSFNK